MKTYLQGRETKKGKKVWLLAFAVFLILAATNPAVGRMTKRTAGFFSIPFLKIGDGGEEKKDGFLSIFKNKRLLTAENETLRRENEELKNKLSVFELIKTESEELKASLGRMGKKDYVLSYILSKPPKSPYDMIIIDAGSESGAIVGMRVIASEALIGHIAEVFPRSSKVRLVSFSGEETNVIVGGAKINAIGTGLGGGNIEIKIPGSVEVKQDDKILTEGGEPILVGNIDKIEKDPLSPFQKILFHLPVNLNELQKVFVEKQ
ncbi:rod shape-determining protein MreC [Candidatus Parcubacteria bacterium]|nr:MAG: rod shape-determining protein MreC [Candidatus Parcubacteria bacterium]